jgi:hypothetical protein
MPKVTTLLCSRKKCKRKMVGGKYRTCQQCRDMNKKSQRKRKEKAAKRTAKDGHRICKNCCKEQPESHFKSCINRRETLVKLCATCRASNSKSCRNETTKKGQCRKILMDWRDLHSCVVCGTRQCIEADHPLGQKVHNCSDYAWWAWNGGAEALRKELSICRPLCTFDHRLHSQLVRGVSQRPSIVKKRAYVNAYKLKVGKCEICERKVQGEKECCAFDLDHLAESDKRDDISVMVDRYSLKKFFKYIDEELSKTRLLCSNCHLAHTKDQLEENRAEHMINFLDTAKASEESNAEGLAT